MLIATPEYNHSIPGVLKNALDWVSRPLAESPALNKPAAVISSSTGMFGGVWAAAETRKVLGALGARCSRTRWRCRRPHERLADGVDEALDAELRSVVHALTTRSRRDSLRPLGLGREKRLDRSRRLVERVPEERVAGGDAHDLQQLAERGGMRVEQPSYGR